jgi:diguanylate cyclase (GGDEF)-like protein/PAS domain S-box-containing protein
MTGPSMPASPDADPAPLLAAAHWIRTLRIPAFVMAADGTLVHANRAAVRHYPGIAVGDPMAEVFGLAAETFYECLAAARANGAHSHAGITVQPQHRVDVTLHAVYDEAAMATVAGYSLTMTDAATSHSDRGAVDGFDIESVLGQITDSIDIPMSYIDADLKILYMNRSSARLWRQPLAEIVGRNMADTLPDEVLQISLPYVRRALAGETLSYERRALLPEGLRWIRVTLVPDQPERGRVQGVFSIVMDIDGDRRLREALADRERQLVLFTANIPEAIAYINAERRYTFVNETFARYRGMAREQIIGKSVADVIGAEGVRYLDPIIEEVRKGTETSYERKVRLASGIERWIRVRITPDFDAEGRYAGHYVVGSDVHDLKVAKEQLETKERQLRLFMDSIPEAIAYVDANWRYAYANHNFVRTRAKPGVDPLGMTPIDLLGDSVGGYLHAQLPKLMAGETIIFEREATFHGELPRWIRTTLVPNLGPEGAYLGYYVVSIDIHELKLAQQTLAASEQAIREFINKLPVAVAYVGTNDRFVLVNPLFCEYMDLDEAALLGRTPYEVGPADRGDSISANIEKVKRLERVSYDRRLTATLPHGDINATIERWLEVTLVPDLDLNGRYAGHFVIAIDVLEARSAEAAVRSSEAELWQMIDSIPSPLAYVDAGYVYRYANQSFLNWFSASRSEVVGRPVRDVLGEARYLRGKPFFERALAGEMVIADRKFTGQDGDLRWMQALYTPRRDGAGRVMGFYFITVDIHDKKVAEEALTRANWMLESHLQNTPLAAMEWDEQFRIIRWSRQAERIFGWKESEVLHRPFTEIRLIHADDRDSFGHVIARLVSGAANKATSIQRMTNKAGEIVWCEWYHSVLRATDGQLISVLSLSQDVSGRIQAEERLQRLATHDGLTGLPNRILLQDRLQQAIARAKRAEGRVVTLFIDLDHFKEVNDAYGHRVGDELLKEVTRRIRGCLRETDLLSRLSGDEFIVLMEGVAALTDAQTVATRILDEVRGITRIDGHAIKISASLGVSVFPDDADTAEAMLRNADLAMYKAKEQGKNMVETFSADLETTRQSRRDLEKAIAEAIAEDELKLYYQPVVDVVSGRVRGLEALIRWRRRDGTLVLPNRFVPLAEETGLIREIGPWTLRTAAAALARWQAMGHDVAVAINLAPRFFLSREAVPIVLDAIAMHACDPRRVILEVTETGMLAHLDSVRDTLSELRAAGLRIALDDFGTGYSSLAYLRHLPVDTIKIDRTFVANLPDHKSDVAITSAIFALANSLGVDVVAEGVETHAQLEYLRSKGCNAYQGYLFSHPLPESEIDALLRTLGTLGRNDRG